MTKNGFYGPPHHLLAPRPVSLVSSAPQLYEDADYPVHHHYGHLVRLRLRPAQPVNGMTHTVIQYSYDRIKSRVNRFKCHMAAANIDLPHVSVIK